MLRWALIFLVIALVAALFGFGAWLRREPKTGIEDLDNMIAAEMSKGIRGVPLKMASVTTTKDQRGNETKTNMTMEVTALKQEAVPAATFAIPKDYERTELAPAMPGRP